MTLAEKHIWLIETIRRAGRISLEELSQKWRDNEELSCGKSLQRCTFNRWRIQIGMQYGVDIECEKCGSYQYYIANPEEMEDSKLKKWMLDSVGVSNIIAGNKGLSTRIVVDEIPSGRDFLAPILAAMRENRVLRMTYQAFGRSSHTFDIEPYCIKLHQNRWYVLGKGGNGKLWLYGLDRIKDLSPTGGKFKMPCDFNANDFFAHHFGILVHDGTRPCRIVLRAYDSHVDYMRSLPLHPSQEEVSTEEGCYSDFQYFLAPTFDFQLAVLGMGSFVEVIEPASLRKEMRGWVCELGYMYNNENGKKSE